jgi:acyl-CoA thioesterase-1
MSTLSKLSKLLKSNALNFNKLALATWVDGLKPRWLLLFALVASTTLTISPLAHAQAPTAGSVILVVGDSLSAEYGLKRGTGWVPLLEQQLVAEKSPARVVNASISGDTTSGGRSRLAALLTRHKPAVVVLELGGNDALRGLPLDMTAQNLSAMTRAAKTSGAKVLLVGMQVPPNYGSAYSAGFAGLFPKIAKAEKVALVPFLLKGIADASDATAQFQADRIHPNAQAQPKMLANVWLELKKLIP